MAVQLGEVRPVPGTWMVASAAVRRPVYRGDEYPHVHGAWVLGPNGRRYVLERRDCWCCPALEVVR